LKRLWSWCQTSTRVLSDGATGDEAGILTGDRGNPLVYEGRMSSDVKWAHSDLRKEITPDAVSALEISIHPEHQGKGLSALLLNALRDNAKSKGFTELLAPVRPNGKHLEPHTSMSEYAFRTREDGLPADPWLRVHVRAGGTIVKVAPASQTISGSLAQWRAWTGQPFDVNGPVEVPLTLSPVMCDLAQNYAVYVEPNVWVRHSL
ncbi:GNAT family N-acetyltransferase, partial [Nonomuraea sp. KC401]